MTKMNRSRLTGAEDRSVVAQWEGLWDRWNGRMGLADVSYYM